MPSSGARSEGWFADLYAAHHSQVVRYALRRLGDPDASLDLAQEVFIVAWRRRLDVPDRHLPWLYGVARRLLANHWRARRAAPEIVTLAVEGAQREHIAAASTGQAAGDRLDRVSVALASLSDMDQEILRLIGWEELTVTEAAVVLGCRAATAAVRLHRARRRLAEALRSIPPDSDEFAFDSTRAREIRHV
ncbi:sigma-70 family RNA polymerase sigma factor [Dactylosporangium sp. NPDC000555]|uniref:RNA polymerase sigma factor n=1 Tax=Dactylosporangium sp. NPDC000555 TaxID=3154260 RepID=UPI0033242391